MGLSRKDLVKISLKPLFGGDATHGLMCYTIDPLDPKLLNGSSQTVCDRTVLERGKSIYRRDLL